MYVLFCIFSFHRANWYSSATLTEVFPCFFLSRKANKVKVKAFPLQIWTDPEGSRRLRLPDVQTLGT